MVLQNGLVVPSSDVSMIEYHDFVAQTITDPLWARNTVLCVFGVSPHRDQKTIKVNSSESNTFFTLIVHSPRFALFALA